LFNQYSQLKQITKYRIIFILITFRFDKQSFSIHRCHDLAKQLSHYLFLFPYLDLLHKEGVWESITWYVTGHRSKWYYMIESYDECGKVVHRPCSRYISSVQKLNENSIEFSLSTWTRSGTKSSWLHSYNRVICIHIDCVTMSGCSSWKIQLSKWVKWDSQFLKDQDYSIQE